MPALAELIQSVRPVSDAWTARAVDRLNRLTKPVGSLGKLESLAAALVRIRESLDIQFSRKVVFTFAADHGVAESGVSLFPQSVTGQMVKNFLAGGAAVNVLARLAGAEVRVIDAGVIEPSGAAGLIEKRLGPGTLNFLKENAMSLENARRAVEWGADVFLDEFAAHPIDLAGVGEMGIGNSTSAAAVFCALLDMPPEKIAGRGTGLDDAALANKRRVVADGLRLRRPNPSDPLDVLSKVGGFEIGQMAGCYIAGGSKRVPMLVDGFISTAAALLAERMCPALKQYLFFSHASAEGGHAEILKQIGATPLLDLDLRLGEGTAAALAMRVLEASAAIFTEMATFESARVDEAESR
ncbi:nicotinate-nucleotide--dimethylbenzimidazole phosphoribosyltransferase [bacterium]|nr:nicotinate-nucleotide--dimethylbenzimidazole phosphoribosyltransferase [bacterium]